MPQIHEVEFNSSSPDTLQVSTPSTPLPEGEAGRQGRALQVKKNVKKVSGTRSSSSGSSSSRPPLPMAQSSSHRGPGSMSVDTADLGEGSEVARQSLAMHRHEVDQRSIQMHHTEYDQRSVHVDQRAVVQVGVDPEAAVQAVAHAAAQAQIADVETRARILSVEQQATQHVQRVQSEARADAVFQLQQMRHEYEQRLNDAQHTANAMHQHLRDQLKHAEESNVQLQQLLAQSQQRQDELSQVVQSLQTQLTMFKHEGHALQPPAPLVEQNGAVNYEELMRCIQDLRSEVQMLKTNKKERKKKEGVHMPEAAIARPPFMHIGTPLGTSPLVGSPVPSACAGFPTLSPQAPPGSHDKHTPPSSSSSSTSFDDGSEGLPPGGGSPSGPGSWQGGRGLSSPSRAFQSIGVGSAAVILSEKDVYRSKDISLVKVDTLPSSAAEFRAWRNTFVTRIAAIDQTGQDIVLKWLLEGFDAEFLDSGILPRLDAHLGSLLMDPRHLKGELGMRFQTYAERCQAERRSLKGRVLLYMLAQHFRLDLNRGSNLTQQALLDLQLEGYTARDLEKFVQRIEYVLNGIRQSHQPTETTRFTWLYARVKKCRLLQRHIDRTRDSKQSSHCRSWDWLMRKIKDVLAEVREDANEDAIRASLQSKTADEPRAKPKAGAVSVAQEPEGKALAVPKLTTQPKVPSKGNELRKGDSSKGKAKGKGKEESKTPGKESLHAKSAPAVAKPKVPCLYYPKGTCNRGEQCPFAHELPAGGEAKAKPKATPAARADPTIGKATVALIAASSIGRGADAKSLKKSMFTSVFRAFSLPFRCLFTMLASMSELCLPSFVEQPIGLSCDGPSHQQLCGGCTRASHCLVPGLPVIVHQAHAAKQSRSEAVVEWICDSGASRALGSIRALEDQGIEPCLEEAGPIVFDTGNGQAESTQGVVLHGSDFGSVEHRILADCPLVRSLGELVESGKPFVWMPGQMPFFVQSCRDVIVSVKGPVVRAHRVDDYVPVFQETIQVASPKDLAFPSKAVAVEPASAPSVPDVVEHADDSSDVRGEEVAPGGEGASDADSESGEEPFTRIQRLQKEASSLEHQMCHIPKNRYCDTCQRARMYRRKITKKRADPLADRGELEPVTEFGQRVAADFIIVSKTLKDEKETVVLVLRDEFSGFIAAYPAPTRSQDSIVKSVLSFLGPTYFAHPMIMCKTDNAPEFKAACSTLGFVHEPTLSRRFPHNSVLEREIRTLEEITRAAHLGAGFQVITGLWQHSVQYAATAMNAFHPVKDVEGATHNRHMRAAGKLFDGRKLILGQLIYVRRDPLNRHKFEANAAPALFAGWRYDSGPKSHKGVYYALDYAALKSGAAGGTIALSVPCEEVYVPPGAPIMPLKVAAESALADFAEPNAMMYLPKEVPFSNLPTDAPPVVRHEYITLDRIIRFGPTPDCSACSKTSGRHNNRCKIRFDRLVKAEKASKIEKVPVGGSLEALPGTPDPGVPETPVDVAKPTVMLESSLVEDDAGEDPAALPFSAGIPPGAEEAESGKGLLLRPNLAADREFLESNRERRLYRRSNMLPGEHTLFEYACAPDSVLSQACEDVGVEGIQLAHE